MDENRELKNEELEQANGGYDVNIWDIAVKLKEGAPEDFNNNKRE